MWMAGLLSNVIAAGVSGNDIDPRDLYKLAGMGSDDGVASHVLAQLLLPSCK